jgi:hypothetical protein
VEGSNEISRLCRLPNASSPFHLGKSDADRAFILFSPPGAYLTGIGNLLVYYPAAYAFAVLTGRDFAIHDNSIFGKLCKVYKCGFPMVSTLKSRYPQLSAKSAVKNTYAMHLHFTGEKNITELVVDASGYMQHHSMGLYAVPHAAECIASISQCRLRDFACYERFALQQLLVGPFTPESQELLMKRITGAPGGFVAKMVSSPIGQAPHADIGLHVRIQSQNLEKNLTVTNESAIKLVLHSPGGITFMENLVLELKRYFSDPSSHWFERVSKLQRAAPVVYVSCDVQPEKAVLMRYLHNNSNTIFPGGNIHFLHHTNAVIHTKFLLTGTELYDSFLDTVFDWYMLAHSDTLYLYRNSALLSTFAESASRAVDREVNGTAVYSKLFQYNAGKGRFQGTYEIRHSPPK